MFTLCMDEQRSKILLYAKKSCICSPLVSEIFGKNYNKFSPCQLADNFSFNTKNWVRTKHTYTKYNNLPLISKNLSPQNWELTDLDFGHFLAGLIEGDGWFGKSQLHIVFAQHDISLAYFIKKKNRAW